MHLRSPMHLLGRAQKGDRDARERLLEEYRPFVLGVVAKTCGRYVTLGEDDEASIGLLAFNEAIDCYKPSGSALTEPDKGDGGSVGGFLAFSEAVIRRRLIDYFRSSSRHDREVLCGVPGQDAPLREEGEDGPGYGDTWPGEFEQAALAYELDQRSAEQRDEIARFSAALLEFGLKFDDLVEASPKHEDVRRWALGIARMAAGDASIRNMFLSKKDLPVQEMARRFGIPARRLKRQKRYLTALTLIFSGDFPSLEEYLTPGSA
ncbi:MAG TPA: sigma-70 family RNA polymerase sigma factor [Clostridia bacterium]|nr:sigma-70 family RNA polymerase sigma factor [Clostridia bacterium]